MHKKYFGNTPPSEKYSKKRTCQQKCMIVFRDGLQKIHFTISISYGCTVRVDEKQLVKAAKIIESLQFYVYNILSHNWFIPIPKFSVTDWNQSLTQHITIYWDGRTKVTYACVWCFTLSSDENRKQGTLLKSFSQAENIEYKIWKWSKRFWVNSIYQKSFHEK